MPRDKVYPHEGAETTLVNLENVSLDEVDIYIGSENESYSLDDSPFMNPFDHAKKGYDSAVEHYKLYFFRRYLSEPKFKELTHELKGKRLGGWCYPRPSHGEVIIELLDEHSDGGEEAVREHIKSELDNIDKTELGVKGFREYEAAREEL
jgi:hypothetical protein